MRPQYRIWDKENNRYWEPTYEAYKGNVEDLSISPSGDLMMRTHNQAAIHESTFSDRFEVEMFTGLLDKNKNRVFEGDIISGMGWTDKKELYIVSYNDYEYYLETPEGFDYEYYNGDYPYGDRLSAWAVETEGKVVGNIHQNKSLLEEYDDKIEGLTD